MRVMVEEEEEETEDGVGEGEELGAVDEEEAGPAVGDTSGRKHTHTQAEQKDRVCTRGSERY